VPALPGSPVLRLTKEDVDRLVHEHKIRCKQLRDKFQMKCEEYQVRHAIFTMIAVGLGPLSTILRFSNFYVFVQIESMI